MQGPSVLERTLPVDSRQIRLGKVRMVPIWVRIRSMTPELQTKRLFLRPLQLSDAEQTQRLFPQWDIVKFLNSRVPWPYPSDRVLNVYRNEILPGIERGE